MLTLNDTVNLPALTCMSYFHQIRQQSNLTKNISYILKYSTFIYILLFHTLIFLWHNIFNDCGQMLEIRVILEMTTLQITANRKHLSGL